MEFKIFLTGGRPEVDFFGRILFYFNFFYYFINAIISTLHISSLYYCLDWYLAHSYILLYFDVFFFTPEKYTLFNIPNLSPPTVFDLGGLNGHHFVGNWVVETVTYHFFNIRSLSSKNMQQHMQKMWFFEKKIHLKCLLFRNSKKKCA